MYYLRGLALLSLMLTGCGTCGGRSAGFEFRILNPPMIATPSLVASGPSPIGCVGLGTYEMQGDHSVSIIPRGISVNAGPSKPMTRAEPETCTLEAVCSKLATIELQLKQLQSPEVLSRPRKCVPPNDEE